MDSDFEDRLEEMWKGLHEEQALPSCRYAELYRTVAEQFILDAEKSRNLALVYRAMVMSTKQYMALREKLPKSHRYKVTDSGHICLFNRFEEYWHRLEILEMSLMPVEFYPPQLPPSEKPAETERKGIFIGER